MTDSSKNLDLDFGDSENAQLRHIVQRLSDFISLYEAAEEKAVARKKAHEKQLSSQEEFIDHQLYRINATISYLEDILLQANASKWHDLTQKILLPSKDSVATLQAIQVDTVNQIKQSTERLSRATSQMTKGLNDALHSLRGTDFKYLTEESANAVQTTSIRVLQSLKNAARWFHWKNLLQAVFLAIFTTIMLSQLMNGEWPWEKHVQVLKQRHLGQALLNVWPQLSSADQAIILKHASND